MIKLVIPKEIYSQSSIETAKGMYKKLALITVVPLKNQWIVVFTHCKYGDERTAKEFENYLIGLENT